MYLIFIFNKTTKCCICFRLDLNTVEEILIKINKQTDKQANNNYFIVQKTKTNMNFNEETIDVFIFPDNHHRNDESSKKRMRDHSSN